MKTRVYTVQQVLAAAKTHPFYTPGVQYPPDRDAVQKIVESGNQGPSEASLSSWPLATKDQLYRTIRRLVSDTSSTNTYRDGSYISMTGGSGGGLPMPFATDSFENREQRARMGEFIRLCGVIEPGDWVLTVHTSGGFYRSLDLMVEILENAGASVLPAGHAMSLAEVVEALVHYRVNVLSGDSSQIVRVSGIIAGLPAEERQNVKLTKIIYTSEPLTDVQRAYIREVLGPIQVYSVLGSCEAGPWALSNPEIGQASASEVAGAADFVFDTRTMLVDILDPSVLDNDDGSVAATREPLPDGSLGIVVQTSLQRLKNPLVRYVTGDIGSLHPVPESAVAKGIPAEERQYLRILRLHGRDRRFSFKWSGEYLQFDWLAALLQTKEWRILQWQVVLAQPKSFPDPTLEIRLLLPASVAETDIEPESRLVKAIEQFCVVTPGNRHLFQIKILTDLTQFERSSTGRKVIKFIDRT
ncbi:uncharacterized protein C8A04DRAFT_32912 [Dichotomopilus funicola]|uniref:Uncharacterized protein n=1 Tax=Dichotomopilus funicola TaxID=1934379 RepID=A0AAN6UVJ0_9PEZI|nr:hypothetical protein C8A04DRAFT_32912 [Dichotomopilus funicola]